MFKQIISYVVIFSIFFVDAAPAMRRSFEGLQSESEEKGESRRRHTVGPQKASFPVNREVKTQSESVHASTSPASEIIEKELAEFNFSTKAFKFEDKQSFSPLPVTSFDKTSVNEDDNAVPTYPSEEENNPANSLLKEGIPVSEEAPEDDALENDPKERWKKIFEGLSNAKVALLISEKESAPGTKYVLIEEEDNSKNPDHPSPINNLENDLEKEEISFTLSKEVLDGLSPAARAFLLHVKDRIIDGKLNKKQMAGIVGGLLTGGAVALPLASIFSRSVWEVMNALLHHGLISLGLDEAETITITIISALTGILGSTLGLDAASRTTTVLIDLLEPSSQPFSLQKERKHKWMLRLTKGGIYVGAFVAGTLPVFYFTMELGYTNVIGSGDSKFFYLSALPFLMFDTVLCYGPQLSQWAERRINGYFFHKMREETPLSPTEIKRQTYLSQFKDLKRMIYGLDKDDLNDFYKTILINRLGNAEQNAEMNPRDLKMEGALRVLQVFQTFQTAHKKNLKLDDEEDTKNVWASRLGWGKAIAATVGRSIVFWYAIYTILDVFGVHEIPKQILSVVFGGIVANLIQGAIEKEAVHQGIYDLSKGRKIPDATSHRPLRVGIKAWNYLLFGPFNTLPYVLALLDATICWNDPAPGVLPCSNPLNWPLWATILAAIPFTIADAFNNAAAFNKSYGDVVSGVDSAASYVYPSMGYKRDKLIRMTRQLRRLFKELRPDVLESVDRILTGKEQSDVVSSSTDPNEISEDVTDELSSDWATINSTDSFRTTTSSTATSLKDFANNYLFAPFQQKKSKVRNCWPNVKKHYRRFKRTTKFSWNNKGKEESKGLLSSVE